ncbi:MAG: hypothetical protein B7Y88_05990 [Sphingomonadales bacterium 32-64-17]|nr:MAG: hypothetical protein B7Y88_05990 [Sphingomonadales bacterium 32-64-17]
MALPEDHEALAAATVAGTGLCTIVNIEGSFSRRLGAQLAVHADGSVTGSLADGCLERELAAEVARGGEPRVIRYGAGSPKIDFRLPCGGGLDILIDPAPDHAACAEVLAKLEMRQEASLALPGQTLLAERRYIPALRLVLLGEGPELEAMARLGAAAGMMVDSYSREDGSLSLGQRPEHIALDRWSALVLLFHDHEWEEALLDWGLRSPAFFIGAQGGKPARTARSERLAALGYAEQQIARIASPLGLIGHSREPSALALSALAGVAGIYELRHPHHSQR